MGLSKDVFMVKFTCGGLVVKQLGVPSEVLRLELVLAGGILRNLHLAHERVRPNRMTCLSLIFNHKYSPFANSFLPITYYYRIN